MTAYLQDLYALFSYRDLLLIFLAIVAGLIIGVEREYKNKPAGLRTLMLVSVGSCTFTILSIKIGVENPDRLAANVITGIGFLGAGAIFRDENKINGVTTACTIWVTAALGMCIGSGHIYLGILATGVVIFVLWNVLVLEKWIDKINRIHIYRITTAYEPGINERFRKLFEDHGLRANELLLVKSDEKITTNWRVSGHQKNHKALGQKLLADGSILRLEM